jgi:hypothetical protein
LNCFESYLHTWKLLERSRVPAEAVDDLDQLQKLFRYVDIESSDWCRALRLVKLIFMSDLQCFVVGDL